jgi:hypothetical protein
VAIAELRRIIHKGREVLFGRTRNCVMFHVGRSGSTVLADMLGQHPQIFSDSEIYTDYRQHVWRKQPGIDPETFTVKRIRWEHWKSVPGGGIYLFECKFEVDMRFFPYGIEGYLDFLAGLGPLCPVVLRRNNVLRRFVSNALAMQRGKYQRRTGEEEEIQSICFDPAVVKFGAHRIGLLEAIDLVEAEFARLERALADRGLDWLPLSYEGDIERDPMIGFRKVCDYLGITPADAAPRFARINSQPLSRILQNFDEVAVVLAGTPHEWMVEG